MIVFREREKERKKKKKKKKPVSRAPLVTKW